MKLYLLTAKYLGDFAIKVIKPLLDSNTIKIVGVCVDDKKPKSIFQRFKISWKKGRGGYIFVAGMKELIKKLKRPINISAEHFFKDKNIPIYFTKDLYMPETINYIKILNPDCIALISGFGIIKKPILTLAPVGVISYHHGNIRKYRGRPVGFWELYNNEKEMSATIQILDKGLDCGKIVTEKKFTIYQTDTWTSLQKRVFKKSINMMFNACILLQNRNFVPKTIEKQDLGTIYTSPNFRKWLMLYIKILWRKMKNLFIMDYRIKKE